MNETLQGRLSFLCYRVTRSNDTDEAILNGLLRGRISAVDVDLGHDRATGFCVFDDPLSTEFVEANVFVPPYALFQFRMDRLAVPSTTLRLYGRRRLAEVQAETSREHLSRAEREDILDRVRADLLRRAIPSIATVRVVWDLDASQLWFFSASKTMAEEFVMKAQECLGVTLRRVDPTLMLDERLNEREQHEAYHLLPATFLGATLRPGAAREAKR